MGVWWRAAKPAAPLEYRFSGLENECVMTSEVPKRAALGESDSELDGVRASRGELQDVVGVRGGVVAGGGLRDGVGVCSEVVADVTTPFSSESKLTPTAQSNSKSINRIRVPLSVRIALLVVLLITLLGTVGIGFLHFKYDGKVAPNTTLAGHAVGGMTYGELMVYLQGINSELMFDITADGVTQRVSGANIGVSVDVAATAELLLSDWSSGLWPSVNPLVRKERLIIGSYNLPQLQAYLDETFDGVPASNPTFVFNPESNTWALSAGQSGNGVSALALFPAIQKAVAEGGARELTAQRGLVDPFVTDAAATAVAQRLASIAANPPTISYQGAPLYTVTPSDVNAWMVLTPNVFDHTFELSFNADAISADITGALAPALLIPGRDEFRLQRAAGEEEVVLQSGADGLRPASPSELAATLAAALIAGTGDVIEPQWGDAPFTIKHMTVSSYHLGRWVDINLSAQTLLLFDGDTPVAFYRISSGKEDSPTPSGSYYVSDKSEAATISGPTWHYNDVTWIAWNRLYGIVGASWRSEFGLPVSEGLIEVTPEAAANISAWLTLGDPIEVHN
ncbi:MAG: L,D-transpeptidase [Propionibacteriaceae bacterium]|jgi:hypothetical protein|nr:L,D-transpeptidase [Propionibacteriaceae bacterium]